MSGRFVTILCGTVALAVLMALAIVGGRRASERAKRQLCLSNMKYLPLAFMMYTQDNRGYMPPADGPDDPYFWVPYLLGDEAGTRPRYYGMPSVQLAGCPAVPREERLRGHEGERFNEVRRDPERYIRFHVEPLLAGRHEGSRDDWEGILLAWEDAPYHLNGRCVLYLSGHAKWLEESDFQAELNRSRRWLRTDPPSPP